MRNYILNKEKDELLYTYFSVFVNLYGRIELDKAMEIIKSQNYNIKLTDEEINMFSSQYEKGVLYRGVIFILMRYIAAKMIQIDNAGPNEAFDRIAILAQGKFDDFKNQEQALKYGELYTGFYNNTRQHRYRGHTPKEDLLIKVKS